MPSKLSIATSIIEETSPLQSVTPSNDRLQIPAVEVNHPSDEDLAASHEGELELAKTVGSPAFFAPELCSFVSDEESSRTCLFSLL